MSSTTVITLIMVPLVVAIISAVVIVRTKRAEVRTTTDQVHKQDRVEGYEHLLAGFDAQWYWNLKSHMEDLPEDEHELSELRKRWLAAQARVLHRGRDMLRTYSHDVMAADLAVAYIDGVSGMALDKVNVDYYEQARDVLVDCQRGDIGLPKHLRLGGVRFGGVKRWARKLAAMHASVTPPPTRMERLSAQAEKAGVEGVMVMDDGSALREWLQRWEKDREDMEASLELTATRLEHWLSKGIWTEPLP